MEEFFKGWRRKLSGVTLMSALVAMGGWIRSFSIAEEVLIYKTGVSIVSVGSASGKLAWTFSDIRKASFISNEGFYTSCEISPSEPFEALTEQWFQPQFKFCGIVYGTGPVARSTITFVQIPYWYVVNPLTLLSAYLILCPGVRASQGKESGKDSV